MIVLFCLLTACKDTFENSMANDQRKLDSELLEIKNMVQKISCVADSEWRITPIGSKGCGGPTGYISYSVEIDTTIFLKKVNEYTTGQKEFNNRWGTVSDCSIPQKPKSIVCENGRPKFVY